MTEGATQPREYAPLRVAYILHRYPCLTETFIMREMSHLRQHGVELQIFSLLPPRRGLQNEQADELLDITHYGRLLSVPVLLAQLQFLVCFPTRYVRSFWRLITQTWREPAVLLRAVALFPRSVAIAAQMQHLRIQHVHAHFIWLEGLAAGVVQDLVGIPFSIHPHGFDLFWRNQNDVRAELCNAKKVITVSRFHQRYIASLCPSIPMDEIEIVYYGLDTDEFQPPESRPVNEIPQIFAVGRLTEKKGFEYLIDACAKLVAAGRKFRCDIVGDGMLRASLERQIANANLTQHVHLRGAMTQNQIQQLYHRADVFALPCVVSRDGDRDGLPVVLIEAMACGLPVVTTNVTGIPELVHHQKTGLIVEERNADQLAAAIEQLLDDEELRKRLGVSAREIILTRCRSQRNSAKMARIFRELADVPESLSPQTRDVPTSKDKHLELDRV